MQHDLLTDKKVAGTFGDGTARYTAAAAAAAERVALGSARKPTSKPTSSEASRGLDGSTREAKDEGDSGRLAGFLSSVLKGLADAEVEDQVRKVKGKVVAVDATVRIYGRRRARFEARWHS